MKAAAVLLCTTTAAAASQLNFLTIGDWGGVSDLIPVSPAEHRNNIGMGAVAEGLGGVEFVMALGDNFYLEGIKGDKDSERFDKTFEHVFTHDKLQVPWYVIAGNHDHYGNVSAEIAYTQVNPSQRWKFPALYYSFARSFTGASGANVTVQVVYFDSFTMAGMSYHDHETGEFVAAPGPPDAAAAATQLQWLEDEMRRSRADYLFVAAHYPVWSHCSHGPTAELVRDVLPLLKRYNATGYLSGHDHCLGHYEDEGVFFSLSGAGTFCCYPPSHEGDIPAGSQRFGMDLKHTYGSEGGFASFVVTEQNVRVTYHDAKGKALYASAAYAPRRFNTSL